MKISALLILTFIFSAFSWSFSQCNGEFSLCQKRYDEVAYLTTHNAFNSSQGGFTFPNHNFDIEQQLNDGVRALMIDVYNLFGNAVVYHGTSILGTSPLQDELEKIKNFLDLNPNEVVTVILECYVDANTIESELTSVGLINDLYTHTIGTSWPTLEELINMNKRCLIFSDENDAGTIQGWYHYMWDHMVETHFSVNSINDFTCDYNRGDPQNDLFILNHFITNAVGVGVESEAEIANSNPFFLNRALQCQTSSGKLPNFVTVDFYELGDSKLVVDQLNGVAPLTLGETIQQNSLKITPTITERYSELICDESDFELRFLTYSGRDVTEHIRITQLEQEKFRLDLVDISPGMYIVQSGSSSARLIKQ